MWLKFGLVVFVAFAVFSTSPAKALLVDGSYLIELTGSDVIGPVDPSAGTFDVSSGLIQNFALDLLSGGVPANIDSRYVGVILSNDPGGLTMFSGIARNSLNGSDIFFDNNGDWFCLQLSCSSSGGFLVFPTGTYSITQVSAVPLPPAIWLFITGLGGPGLLGRRRNKSASA